MRTPTQRIYGRLGLEEFQKLEHEAAARNATITACLADCLREYFTFRAELATAITIPGQPGDGHTGLIHVLHARTEERIATSLEAQANRLLDQLERLCHQVQRLESMLDRFVQLYLMHTPEVTEERRADAIAHVYARYANYRQAVDERLAGDGANGTGEPDDDASWTSQARAQTDEPAPR